METPDARTVLARLEGFLKAFEWMNHKSDHGCSYFVATLPAGDDIAAAVAERFSGRPAEFHVEAIANVDDELRNVFRRFLFLFRDRHGDHLVDPRRSFSLTHDFGQKALLDNLADMMRAIGVRAAWRIQVPPECGELYECFQDDIVVAYSDGLCLLHFGVSD
jgi:hypothetical protein